MHSSYSSKLATITVATLLCVLVVGCDSTPELGIVTGTVKAGDEPLGEVMVQFMPEPGKNKNGMMSSALTDENGQYRLGYSHRDGGEGAEIGMHLVILKDYASENHRGKGQPPPIRIPKPMRQVGDTPLRFEVKPGEQTIDIDILSP